MVVLLGRTGYIGGQFAKTLQERGIEFIAPLRSEVDYGKFPALHIYLKKTKPKFVINAAGFTGKPNVDACENNKADTLQGNTLFPIALAQTCLGLEIPYGHVSSGCIFAGAKVTENGQTRVEKDLTRPELQTLLQKNPTAFSGFKETDEPNFTFRHPPCSFYSGSKALAEDAMAGVGSGYIWRLRIPFDEQDNPRNYLSKLRNYAKVYDNVNSLSHRADFVSGCLDLWLKKAAFGTYNVTNPGFVTSRQVVGWMQELLKPSRSYEFWVNDEEFYQQAARTPRSNCIMDVAKMEAAGVKLRPVEAAVRDALTHWVPIK